MYIITGGAGFLGSALLWALNERGVEDILVVDNLARTEKWKNLVPRRFTDYMHRDAFIRAVREGNAPSGARGVVHLGACASTTERDADFLMENNFHYSRDLCLWARERGARFVNASSAATYGDGSLGFDDAPDGQIRLEALRPLNMYGYSKHLFDLWARGQGLLRHMVSLKFFNVYGPNEYHKGDMRSVVCKGHTEIRATGRLRLFRSCHPDYADGGQMRDFVYVKDIARLMADLLLTRQDVLGIFNVGTGQARTWNDLAAALFCAMHVPVKIEYIEMPTHLAGKYQNYTCAPIQRLCATGLLEGGMTRLEDGIADYVGYLDAGACL